MIFVIKIKYYLDFGNFKPIKLQKNKNFSTLSRFRKLFEIVLCRGFDKIYNFDTRSKRKTN